MSCPVEVIGTNAEKNAPSRWVLYLEKKQAGETIFSRRGPDSSTRTFGSLDGARDYVAHRNLEDDPALRCIRIYRFPL